MKKLLSALFIGLIPLIQAQTGITNLDFENWSNGLPSGFFGTGLTQETTTPQSGNSYAKITSNGSSSNVAGYMLILNTTSAKVGAPYAQRPISLTGYIRTNLVGTDSVFIDSYVTKSSPYSYIGLASQIITQNHTTWHQITIPFTFYNSNIPDTISVSFSANKAFRQGYPTGGVGTYLEIDNFSLVTSTTGLTDFSQYSALISAYPNPAVTDFFIDTKNSSTSSIDILSMDGRLIKTIYPKDQTVEIDLENFTTGIYMYVAKDKNNHVLKSDKFTVTK